MVVDVLRALEARQFEAPGWKLNMGYGLVNIDEPRYIVFDVSGIIELDFGSQFESILMHAFDLVSIKVRQIVSQQDTFAHTEHVDSFGKVLVDHPHKGAGGSAGDYLLGHPMQVS